VLNEGVTSKLGKIQKQTLSKITLQTYNE